MREPKDERTQEQKVEDDRRWLAEAIMCAWLRGPDATRVVTNPSLVTTRLRELVDEVIAASKPKPV